MYEHLDPGTVRHTFTDSNLTLIDTDADRFMKVGHGLSTPAGMFGPLAWTSAGTESRRQQGVDGGWREHGWTGGLVRGGGVDADLVQDRHEVPLPAARHGRRRSAGRRRPSSPAALMVSCRAGLSTIGCCLGVRVTVTSRRCKRPGSALRAALLLAVGDRGEGIVTEVLCGGRVEPAAEPHDDVLAGLASCRYPWSPFRSKRPRPSPGRPR